ncbi:hypothetical protein [Wenzhouxiangella sediminis]|uniref:Uncharacterized protein n=1 Tax=Wenzhouxiangella sediminis TaxID=1792836 RepID=A0A3E1KAP0_9GAMM|nr:hypothetical protein [Wenzhouxiangella sediminis]RFF30867.1 hypothetical protein DZC52_06385 [Wenzhouxiangella sediminis]
MSWYRLELEDAVLAQTQLAGIAERAREAFEAAGRPDGWGVYCRHVSGALHCRAEVYFSPAAGDLGRELGAVPFAEPGEHPSLLVGDGDSGL